jgi:MFS family permease
MATALRTLPQDAVGRRGTRAWQLTACSAMHVVNDALFAGLYPLLPLVAADLALSYAQVGAIKTVFTGSSSILQVPAGIAAERFGEHLLLALGTGWVGLGLIGMALAAGYLPLLALSLVGGIGGNTQHPVATSVVSRLFEAAPGATGATGASGAAAAKGPSRGWAIGMLNFAGDVGKVLAPILVGVVALAYGWRGALLALGLVGVAFPLLYYFVVPAPDLGRPVPALHPHAAGLVADGSGGSGPAVESVRDHRTGVPETVTGWGIARPGLFAVLSAIGMLDAAARGAARTFIPFVLQGKGFDPASMSAFFTALFAAGAAGKFLCGPLGDRYGNVATIAVTELITAASIVGLLGAPAGWVLAALLPLGFVLNGTSSVLYASVASLVHASRRARGYGLYYTCTQMASALAPIGYGLLADRAGLTPALLALAAVTAAIAPLTLIAGRDLHGDTP